MVGMGTSKIALSSSWWSLPRVLLKREGSAGRKGLFTNMWVLCTILRECSQIRRTEERRPCSSREMGESCSVRCHAGSVNWLSLVEKIAKGKFRSRGEIQRRLDRITGFPFHLWSERGKGESFNEGMINSPTLIEVLDGGWEFTVSVSVAVAGEEDVRRGRSSDGAVGRMKEGSSCQKAEIAAVGTRGKRRPTVGNNWSQPSLSFSLNSNFMRTGFVGQGRMEKYGLEATKPNQLMRKGFGPPNK
ncbi:hypothetical protein CK203_056565 [Vitis vinifera]|uniref:Uncharacterized protein n=1 Tax=Vitis vinifera TaxID=29760 RepID=A0A438GKD5_VITVI|nr:hypothetical protein CK203_056565 [Vitis vinifera]